MNHIIEIFSFIFLLIVIFTLYLLFFSSKYLGLTFDSGQVLIKNHELYFLLLEKSILFFNLNIIWYKSNQYINTTKRLFLLIAISLVICLLYLSKFFISNSLFYTRAKDIFWLIFIDLAPTLYISHCFLSDDILILKFFYNMMSIVIQDKPHIKCFILWLIICLISHMAPWSQPFTSLLFF